MGIKSFSVLALVGSLSVAAVSTPSSSVRTFPGTSGSSSCPAIWSQISAQLTPIFLVNGQCTDLARASIRFAFHDAGTFSSKLPTYWPASGGADGSLLLNSGEIYRSDNAGLVPYYNWLTGFYAQYKDQVSAADLIQFAASQATVTCPGGPRIRTVVGRQDTTQAAPDNTLPQAFGPGADYNVLFKLFEDKGFSAFDLAALIGAHSTSKAFAQQANGIPYGGPQDSTPGRWDTTFYQQTYNPAPGVYRFQSDINLSNRSTAVGQAFSSFMGNQGRWTGAFADAMFRMSLLGIPANTSSEFIDCTSVLPRGSLRRDVRAAPINDRVR